MSALVERFVGLWVTGWGYWVRHVFELHEDSKDNRDLSQMVDQEKWWSLGLRYKDLPLDFTEEAEG